METTNRKTTAHSEQDLEVMFKKGHVTFAEHIARREVTPVDTSTLKPQQLESFNGLKEFLNSSGGGMALLRGYAGTGKTYTSSRIIEDYLYHNRQAQVAVTAPTNKAVKVLYQSADYKHPNLAYLTIHSLLGLREKINFKGEITFVQNKRENSKLGEYQVLLLDEVSMLQDELFELIAPYVDYSNLKVIFMGDPAQIPPVGRVDCMPFDEDVQRDFDMKLFSLTDIVRQGEGNPIIEATLKVRRVLARPKIFVKRTSQITDKGSLIFLDKLNDRRLITDLFEHYFNSEHFKKEADFAKVIAWTNDTVDAINNRIRKMIYAGHDLQKIMVGEKLIADKPIFEIVGDEQTIIFNTNDELIVNSVKEYAEEIEGGEPIHCYKALVDYLTPDGKMYKQTIKIVHERSEQYYTNILNTFKKKALAERGYKAVQYWEQFYNFQKHFASVKYNYAITAHKSQGSTYQNVFVIESDIDKNRKVVERNRIKYTALSRPSEKLFIIA